MRRLMLALPLLLAACREATTPGPAYAPPPDFSPVGAGLSTIGLGLVIASVVIALGGVLGRTRKGGGGHG